MTRREILPEEFVRAYMDAYQKGQSLDDLAQRFGITHSSVLAKTGKFRSQGVKLPHLKSIREVDPSKLNAIIQEMMGTPETPAKDIYNATCADCGKPFYTKTGATYCVNCIKRHPRERSHLEANQATRPCKNCGKQTTKLFCNDECRKDFEASYRAPVSDKPDIKVTQREINESAKRVKAVQTTVPYDWEKARRESDERIAKLGYNRR